VKPSYWLASFPKSGNTWFRMIAANLAGAAATIDINSVHEGIASDRAAFDAATWIDSSLLLPDEIEYMRPAFHRYRAGRSDEPGRGGSSALPFHLIKTHDAYTLTRDGSPLLGGGPAAAGAILLVRDPRDVVPSLAHHLGVPINMAIWILESADYRMGVYPRDRGSQFEQRLLGWSGFNRSWLDQTDIPVHIVRYEDLHADGFGTLGAALEFLRWPRDTKTIERALRYASFGELSTQERTYGFSEAVRGGRPFFRKGLTQGWRDELSPAQAAHIEHVHAELMSGLGY
jgi:aryl sulfotransferase